MTHDARKSTFERVCDFFQLLANVVVVVGALTVVLYFLYVPVVRGADHPTPKAKTIFLIQYPQYTSAGDKDNKIPMKFSPAFYYEEEFAFGLWMERATIVEQQWAIVTVKYIGDDKRPRTVNLRYMAGNRKKIQYVETGGNQCGGGYNESPQERVGPFVVAGHNLGDNGAPQFGTVYTFTGQEVKEGKDLYDLLSRAESIQFNIHSRFDGGALRRVLNANVITTSCTVAERSMDGLVNGFDWAMKQFDDGNCPVGGNIHHAISCEALPIN